MNVNIFIQARMSSARYPGKVLAPLRGQPLILHLINQAKKVDGVNKVVVLTSTEGTDNPLAYYLEGIGSDFFRGELVNVFARFQKALIDYPCEYFIRLCGDSPFVSSKLIEYMIKQLNGSKYDIVSNVVNRTFPKGQSVEIIKTKTFLSIDPISLTVDEREHVTSCFYQPERQFHSLFLSNPKSEGDINMCVDTLEDLKSMQEAPQEYQFCEKEVCHKKY